MILDVTLEQAIRAIWLCDVNPKKGYIALRAVIKGLPAATFFRINLASHLIMRAYWNHCKTEDRLLLLE